MVNQFVVITRDRCGNAQVETSTPANTRDELSVLPYALFPQHYSSVEIVRLVSVGSDGWATVENSEYGTEIADGYFLCQRQEEDAAAKAAAEAARWSCCPSWC